MDLLRHRLIAILRTPTADHLPELTKVLIDAGFAFVEVALTIPDGLAVLGRLREHFGNRAVFGAGTVLDADTARAAIDAGAEFLVAPTFNPEVIAVAKRHGKLAIPGAFTATEILAAWNAGADFVKVFPVDAVGPAYLRSILRPLPHIRLLATGAIDVPAAAAFLRAGACGVGIGGPLCDPGELASGRFEKTAALARKYVEVTREAPCL